VLLGLSIGLLWNAAPAGAEPAPAGLKATFDAMEKGLRGSDEALFKAQWHAEGYDKNLIGGSGNTGARVYKQGTRKKWFLKPDLPGTTVLAKGEAVIVSCDIWSWEKDKAVDRVDALLVKVKGTYVMLGAGEKRAEVDALSARWLDKKPLDPQ
jgi:hypothetical protein